MAEDQLTERDTFAEAETLLAHDEMFVQGAVVPPIFQTSLFTFDTYEEMADAIAGKTERPFYSRVGNPTVAEFEKRIAGLHGAEQARAFSSGMAAIAATLLSFVEAGDRVLAVRNCYSDTYRLFERVFPRFGISVDYVDGSDTEAVVAALPGAKLLYLESPTSMTFELQDVAALAREARTRGIVTAIDNSWATALLQKPMELGVDLVLESASKYLGGHSDTIAGVVAGSAALVGRINSQTFPYLGGKLSPFDAWLLLRGMRTLPLRLRQHMASGLLIAERLNDHPQIARVNHPAFSSHAGKASLLGHGGGLFSIELADPAAVPAFVNALRLFRLGVSWGGHESLVMTSKASLDNSPADNAFARFGVHPGTIRVYVGLEYVDDLWADIAQALEKAGR